jgi:glycosyltransferase involved in cell wall biosynthesis
MKIAYFSPFPWQRTGVALYSDQLVRELQKLMQVDCYDFGNESSGPDDLVVADFGKEGRISQLTGYEAVIYQLGNNPHYHLNIYYTLRQVPGIIVLHDIVLYYLFAGLGRDGLAKHLWLNYGRAVADDVETIVGDSPERDILRYRAPEKYPLTASIFPYATRIVVHNRTARDHLLGLGCKQPIHVIPHLAFPSADLPATETELAALREQHSIREEEVIIGCLGFIGPTKRIGQVCLALAQLKGKVKFRFLIVGEGDDLSANVKEAGLTDLVIRTAFVDARAFSLYLQLTDLVVNLRYPSMGESSGTLTRAMMLSKPCIVSDDAAFADLPADSVVKIGLGSSEVRDLAAAIEHLGLDKKARAALGAAGRFYAATELSPAKIALQFKRVIEASVAETAQEKLVADAREGHGTDVVAGLLRDAIGRNVPPHLRGHFGDGSDPR